jgi:SPP1 family predicted phage head-tail adaptor
LRAGELRKRFTILRGEQTQSNTGDISLTWVSEGRCWGAIKPLSGGESISAEQRIADTTHGITVRYSTKFAADRRLRLGSRVFEIMSVVNVDERNREISLSCKETA